MVIAPGEYGNIAKNLGQVEAHPTKEHTRLKIAFPKDVEEKLTKRIQDAKSCHAEGLLVLLITNKSLSLTSTQKVGKLKAIKKIVGKVGWKKLPISLQKAGDKIEMGDDVDVAGSESD